MLNKKSITCESVTEGHPDKVADRISDSILDAILEKDPRGHVACETLVTTGMVLVSGEVTTSCYVHIPDVVRSAVREIGYNDASLGFDADGCAVLSTINEQSPDIAMGVAESGDHEQGAGDQGIMYGYATSETPERLPLPLVLAHRLTARLAEVRKKGVLPFLRPDGKSQVSLDYEGDRPIRAGSIVIAAQHTADTAMDRLRSDIFEHVIRPSLPGELLDRETQIHTNATGRFVIGGPRGDTGLTGRKIISDSYGGLAPHGGGAFSGKDPSKVDRSASYAARWIARNVVEAGLAEKCLVQIAYAIGVARPVSFHLETLGTAHVDEERIRSAVLEIFDLRPAKIIQALDLLRPIYAGTSAYGHFGRDGKSDGTFPWERADRVDALRNLVFA